MSEKSNEAWAIENEYSVNLYEVEQAYDGDYYLQGYAPTQSIEEQNESIRQQRNARYRTDTDELSCRKMRKQALSDWTEQDEIDYVAAINAATVAIEEDLPYIGEESE